MVPFQLVSISSRTILVWCVGCIQLPNRLHMAEKLASYWDFTNNTLPRGLETRLGRNIRASTIKSAFIYKMGKQVVWATARNHNCQRTLIKFNYRANVAIHYFIGSYKLCPFFGFCYFNFIIHGLSWDSLRHFVISMQFNGKKTLRNSIFRTSIILPLIW